MRITFVLPAPVSVPVGGIKVVYELANRLSRRGHAVALRHTDPSVNTGVSDRVRRLTNLVGALGSGSGSIQGWTTG